MTTPIEKDAMKVLIAMVEDSGDDYEKMYDGNSLKTLTGLSSGKLNDAVSFLHNRDYVEKHQALGTAPYEFYGVNTTTEGRNYYHEIKAQGITEDPSLTVIDNKLIFLSYSSEDKLLAHIIRDLLTEEGFESFLAHEDIVSDRWLPIIEENLRKSACLVVIVTKNFDKRWWTNQEVGYIIGAGKKLFPLFMVPPDRNSMGFLPDYQGETRVTEENFKQKVKSLINKIKLGVLK